MLIQVLAARPARHSASPNLLLACTSVLLNEESEHVPLLKTGARRRWSRSNARHDQFISIYEVDLMRAWSKSSEAMVRSEAQRLITEHGDEAAEIARREARRARNARNHALARKYALVAAYISEQSQSA